MFISSVKDLRLRGVSASVAGGVFPASLLREAKTVIVLTIIF
jgi:hypothetical protein